MPKTTHESSRAWWCVHTTPRDWRNARRLLWLLAVWAVSFVGGAQVISRELVPPGPVSWVVAALPAVLTVFVLIAYGRFLRETDELQRLIQLRSLALGFGGVWFVSTGYMLFERLGAPSLDRGDALLVMVVLYTIGVVVGQWRYR